MDIRKPARNLDLRGLRSFDRYVKFLDGWRKLKEGEGMRIATDSSPDPLKSQLETEHAGQFEWNYEAKGPEKWIFLVSKKPGTDKEGRKKTVKELIRRIRAGEGDFGNITAEDRKMLAGAPPEELAAIEQEIIQEGVTSGEIRSLCDVHLEFLKDKIGDTELKVGPGHPLYKLISEHDVMLKDIERLSEVSGKLEKAENYSSVSEELAKIEKVAGNLAEADRHHALEEEIIFPAVADTGITEPLEIIRDEHEAIKATKKQMLDVLKKRDSLHFQDFARRIKAFAEYFSREYPDHICKEHNILFPIALRAVPADKWKELESRCESSGYCSFTAVS